LINHIGSLIGDFSPWDILPFRDGVLNFGIEGVKLIQKVDLLLGLLQLWVCLMRKSEEVLTRVVGVELSLSDLVFFRLELKSVQGLLWLDSRNLRAVLIEVLSEVDNVFDEGFNTDNQSLLEFGLLSLKVVPDLDSLLNKLLPVLVDDLRWILVALLVDVLIVKVVLEEVVHLDDRSEFDLDGRLLLSDLFKSIHDVTKRVNVLSWLLDLESDVLDLFSQVIDVGLSFLQEILGEGIFPKNDPFLETGLNVVGL